MSVFSPRSKTERMIAEQMKAHGIEFGERYRDTASNFEGNAVAITFFEHACVRIMLRGTNMMTNEPGEFTFDAPDLVKVIKATPNARERTEPVPPGPKTGGPHGIGMGTPRGSIR